MSIQPNEVQAATDGENAPSPTMSPEENARVGKVLQRFASDGRASTTRARPSQEDGTERSTAGATEVDAAVATGPDPQAQQDL